MDSAGAQPRFHVLLVGIDGYADKPLGGCVNDIDAIQRVLLGPRIGLSANRILRLASPQAGASHDTAVAQQPATLANLRAAMRALSSEDVAPRDRVFIYYSGHGSRVALSNRRGRTFHREALVPVDIDVHHPVGMMFDFEINAWLAAITARTRNVTVVLDCCHAEGATRSAPSRQIARFLDVSTGSPRAHAWPDPEDAPRAAPEDLARGVHDCQVIAACRGHERAYEDVFDGVRHGVLTRTLVDALDAVPDPALQEVSWSRIWEVICAGVERNNQSQHPWMAGNPRRAVLAGPPVDGDPGLGVSRAVNGAYLLHAGTLADVTRGARVAIYRGAPAYFPPLDSGADHAARIGVVTVTSAERERATAEAVGGPFELPGGARGRIVRSGAGARMPCAVVPPDPAVVAQLVASPVLDVVNDAAVRLEQVGDRWLLTDEVHDTDPDRPSLFSLSARELSLDGARRVLEHYVVYQLPLRMARRSIDLRGALQIELLAAGREAIAPPRAQAVDLPEVPSRATATYDLDPGGAICFQVRNASPERLRVTLLNVAASGKVQSIGDQIIDGRTAYVFWAGNQLGVPFAMVLPPGTRRCIDRLVAIGRTALDVDLDHLRVDTTFAEAVGRRTDVTRGPRGEKDLVASLPRHRWTATQAILETTDPSLRR